MIPAGMVRLTTLNTGLKTCRVGSRVVDHDNKLHWRTTATTGNGTRGDRRIRLDLPLNSSKVLEAENRVIRLAAKIARFVIMPDPLHWASEIRKFPDSVQNALTIAEAITQLENGLVVASRQTQTSRTGDGLMLMTRSDKPLPPKILRTITLAARQLME